MSDKKNKKSEKDKLLAIDSSIDSTLFIIKRFIYNFWHISFIILSRYNTYGLKRFIVEFLSECLTIGTVGLLILAILGTSILQLTKTDWRNKNNFSVTFLDRYNNIIGQRGIMNSQSVPIDKMPPYLIKAVLATEDRRFYSHIGLDFWGLTRALTQNMHKNGVVQGGSTLTQQLAKNLFLNNKRTLPRKIKEAFLALWLEANYSKKQILQMYLDNAYLGGGNFGINAASEFYFGKNVRQINLAEAAILAGLFKAPSKYAPHIHPQASRERTNVVLDNLVNSGLMNESEVAQARQHPAPIIGLQNQTQPDYFLDYAYEEIKKLDIKFPSNRVIVQTTLDSNIQQIAENAVKTALDNSGKSYNVSQASVVVLANNGGLRAMVGGRDYGESSFNRATRGERQVGSTFKPYVYAMALERGLTPQSIVLDAPINWGGWTPHNNNNRYLGPITLETALTYSINTVAVRLGYEVLHRNIMPIYNFVKSIGIDGTILKHKTMVLGTSNMTTLDQATGFNVFANGGMAGNRHIFLKISTPQGKVLWQYTNSNMYRVLSSRSSAYLNQMMTQVVEKGSGHRAYIPGLAIAGKTGTTQNFKDAWFVGFSGNFTTAIWMGNDDDKPTNRLFGGILPAMIFHQIMEAAHKTVKLQPLYGFKFSDVPNLELEDQFNSMGILSPNSTSILHNMLKAFDND